MSDRYDAVVVGTGQGGKPLAAALAQAGKKTAIIEREERVGGTCVVVGCTPTKTMVASARVAHLARRGPEYGVEYDGLKIVQTTVRKRKRAIVDMFSGGSQKGMERHEMLDLIFGEASFVDPHTLRIALRAGGEQTIEVDQTFINVGARPAIPPIPGLDGVHYLDSTGIMELDEVPAHLIVLGGGPIGLEFAQMYRRFGSDVSVVEMLPRLLAREDEEFSEAMAEVFTGDSVDLLLGTKATKVRQTDGRITVDVTTPDGDRTLDGTHLLVATGRRPNSDSLNLGAAGIDVDERGFIPVNDRLETAVDGIWALGDVNGGPAFTQISYDDFRVIRDNVITGDNATRAGRQEPYVIFTDPQFGRVGLSETEAKERGLNVETVSMPMTHVARALEMDETRGLMKVVVDKPSGTLAGAAVLGIEGGEIMSMLQIAMMGKLHYSALRDGVFAHPTFAEAFNNLFGKLESA